MKREKSHEDTSRVDTMQRLFVRQKNFTLDLPLVFAVYGDHYEIPVPGASSDQK